MSEESKKWAIPTPLEIAILLTFLVFALSCLTTPSSWQQNVSYWGDGFWSLLTFMTQMCLILLGGYVVAVSGPVSKILGFLAAIPKGSLQAYLFTFFISALCCWLNWGLGLVASAFFAMEVSRQNKNIHFPLVVAISYMGFIFWHGGLSGSIPLVVGTPDNFSQKWIGGLIPFGQTVFSSFNLILIVFLFFGMGGLICLLSKKVKKDSIVCYKGNLENFSESKKIKFTKFSWFIHAILGFLFGAYLIQQILNSQFTFSLNQINFILILAGLILHRNLDAYMKAVRAGTDKLGPVLVQYPLYAGVMGIMIKSGLASQISDMFVSISSETTYPVYMFLSAGLVNLFVPSGGGQWAVQAPIVIEGAKELGVPMWKAVMAVAWGDAWTNLAQPFWALPLLSIVGLGIKDIIGYCLTALLVSGTIISLVFLIF